MNQHPWKAVACLYCNTTHHDSEDWMEEVNDYLFFVAPTPLQARPRTNVERGYFISALGNGYTPGDFQDGELLWFWS